MINKFKAIYEKFNEYSELWLAFISIIVIVGIIITMRVEYVPFASKLDEDMMFDVVSTLYKADIKYKEEGTDVLVDKNDLDKAKMVIAVDLNISQQDYSWDDFYTNSNFTENTDEKSQQMNQVKETAIKKALIEGIDGVNNARVEISIADDENISSIVITLELENNIILNDNQIKGIVNFLMNSVNNLSKDNITIINQNGMILNRK